jgi:hypothetical protein
MTAAAAIEVPLSDAEAALYKLSLQVRRAPFEQQVVALRQGVAELVPFIESRDLHPAAVEDEIYRIVNDLGLGGEPGSDAELEIAEIARATVIDDGGVEYIDEEAEALRAREHADIIKRMELTHPVDRLKHIQEPRRSIRLRRMACRRALAILSSTSNRRAGASSPRSCS